MPGVRSQVSSIIRRELLIFIVNHTSSDTNRRYRILLAGSSHTRLMFPAVRAFLSDIAIVTKLPRDAGRSDEILQWMSEWPIEGQDIIHLYSGHRDLAFERDEMPYVGPDLFKKNLEQILHAIRSRTTGHIVVSNVPPVSDGFLKADPDRNKRIELYNSIISEIAEQLSLPCHDFWSFISYYPGGEKKYVDGLHFTRAVYRDFGRHLSGYLLETARIRQ